MKMGNQQETVSPIELSWLGGFIDGEGSIGIIRMMSHRKNPTYSARVSLPNTNIALIEYCQNIVDRLGIIGHLDKIQRSPLNGKNWKDARIIQISNIVGVKNILDNVLPYLRGKDKQAVLVLEFVNSRLAIYKSKGKTPGKPGCGVPYTNRELKIHLELKKLNSRGIK